MKVTGRVVHGSKIGAALGYPTANIIPDGTLSIENGVYAAVVDVDGQRHAAMANLGVKPTFSENGGRVLELHLLGFTGDLYGREVEAELVEFIRPERRFASPEELRTQIARDKLEVEKILSR
jgi:riboflavin kinase/FMN adenylyltransferase